MATNQSVFTNYARLEIEGAFNVSTSGTVVAISYPAGETATCRGDNLSVVRASAGVYTVTYKNSSQSFALVETLHASAGVSPTDFGSTALGTALFARVSNVNIPTSGSAQGDIQFTVTTSATQGGAAADNGTTAECVNFRVITRTNRIRNVI